MPRLNFYIIIPVGLKIYKKYDGEKMALTLMYITNNPKVAVIAQKYGVDRIWVDLEIKGKQERQKNMDTVKSCHSISDIEKIAPLLYGSQLMVRVNPWDAGSEEEIKEVIRAGAQIVMLPMWKTPAEVISFIRAVGGKAKVMLLLETKEAVDCLDEILQIRGIDEIHIGLNDLHLSYKKIFMFELLADGTVEQICRKISLSGIPYGFGGIARIGEGMIPAEKIILEHYRLGSTRAILSRSFCDTDKIEDISQIESLFAVNMKKLRECEASAQKAGRKLLWENKIEVARCVENIVKMKSGRYLCS